ncbi:MAG TPA: hypothetical protein VNT03_10335 [Baekduia sp.]|nr:hypothetical protein [Baekduia sp.]
MAKATEKSPAAAINRLIEDPVSCGGGDGRHGRPEAELVGERGVHAAGPGVGEGFCGAVDRVAGKLGHLEDGDGRVVGDVDGPAVQRAGEGDA